MNTNTGMELSGPEEDISQYLSLSIQPSVVDDDRAMGIRPRQPVVQEVNDDVNENPDELDRRCRLLTAENEELNRVVSELQRARGELERRMNELRGRLLFFESEGMSYMQVIDRLRNERRDLRFQVSSLQNEVAWAHAALGNRRY